MPLANNADEKEPSLGSFLYGFKEKKDSLFSVLKLLNLIGPITSGSGLFKSSTAYRFSDSSLNQSEQTPGHFSIEKNDQNVISKISINLEDLEGDILDLDFLYLLSLTNQVAISVKNEKGYIVEYFVVESSTQYNYYVDLVISKVKFNNDFKLDELYSISVDLYNSIKKSDVNGNIISENEELIVYDDSEVVKTITKTDGTVLPKTEGSVNLPFFIDSTDTSLFIDASGILKANVSIYEESFIYSGASTFTLSFEPTNFLGIFVNGVRLQSTDYIYTSPGSLEVTKTLETDDKITVQYERFINQP